MNKVNIVFLDVDGVLNSAHTKDTINGYIGIDSSKVDVLKEIIHQSNSLVVLSSTWKNNWYRDEQDKKHQDDFANHLDKKLLEKSISIFDKTNDHNSIYRGRGLIDYMSSLEKQGYKVCHILILDDVGFDYKETGLAKYWLKTNFYGCALNNRCCSKALSILKKEFNLEDYK